MQTFEFDPNAFINPDEADKSLLVKFEVKAKKDSAESLKEGRPVFKDTIYVDIRAPGDRLGGICRPATQRDIERFPEHYKAFLNRTSNDEKLVGTPLTEWALVTRSQVEELAFAHVKTVEQLAEMADVHGSRISGFYTLKQKAKDWLQVSKDNAAALELKEQLHQRDQRIAQLESQVTELAKAQEKPATDEIAELRAMVEQLAKPKRGRPKKAKE